MEAMCGAEEEDVEGRAEVRMMRRGRRMPKTVGTAVYVDVCLADRIMDMYQEQEEFETRLSRRASKYSGIS